MKEGEERKKERESQRERERERKEVEMLKPFTKLWGNPCVCVILRGYGIDLNSATDSPCDLKKLTCPLWFPRKT
jgi:hypothetical protein